MDQRALPTLMPLQVVDNRTVASYGGGRLQGGIRYSGSSRGDIRRCCVVMGNAGSAPYDDRNLGDRVIYTGEGLVGNQRLSKGNLVLARSITEGFQVHVFHRLRQNEYRYLGRFRVSSYSTGRQDDALGNSRTVYMFELRMMSSSLE